MTIQDHRSIVSLAKEGLIFERISGIVWTFLNENDFDMTTVNFALSQCVGDNDYFACFGFEFPDGMHACVSFIRDGLPISQFVTPTPGMTKSEALAEALRLVEDYQKGNN